ncbi:hypothetical protein [Salinisphaera sp. T5B8]|uniref:hypothetical protein n=1 Tax=Salinisphaera sp. T5B8 TaxID=1304154 RepID=UPI0033418DC2
MTTIGDDRPPPARTAAGAGVALWRYLPKMCARRGQVRPLLADKTLYRPKFLRAQKSNTGK